MRIAFISFEYPPFIIGGAGTYALNITRELAKLGHQVVVFTPAVSQKISAVKIPNLEIKKVPVSKKLPFLALQFWLLLPNEIKKFEKEVKFDIVHFNGMSYWFLKKKLSKAKHIVTVHHLVKDVIKNNNFSLISRIRDVSGENGFIVSFLEKQYIKSPDKLIAVSNFTKKQIVKFYNVDPNIIEVIYNGIDSKGYLFAEEEVQEAKKQLNLMERPIILFVGRVDDPRKNLDLLLRSIKKIVEKVDVTLLVIGKGDQTKAKKLVDSLGISNNVVFTGFVDDEFLKKCYSLCNIYVCSSKLEGFGLTFVEAMTAKKPIVATNVGAVSEIISNGINGILVKSDDVDDMSQAIFSVLENKKIVNNIGKRNAEIVAERFNWGKNAQRVSEIYYNELVNL